jgi:AcrR family transcriptional regulator
MQPFNQSMERDMAPKLCDPVKVDEDQQSGAIERDRAPLDSTALIEPPVMDWPKVLDARTAEHRDHTINVSSRSLRQQKPGEVSPRARILSAAAELFLRYGIAGVSVGAIVREAATTKPTLYNHFASKDALVAEYLRESAKRFDLYWDKVEPPRSATALIELSMWLAEMADGLIDGWACRLPHAAAELKEKNHPARRVIKTFNALQRRRLTRLCRAAGLRSPSMLADALLMLFDGACIMAPSVGRVGLSSRLLHLGEAMIAAHLKAPLGSGREHQP